MANQIGPASSPDAVRAEIETTRARMSATIDEIEGVLLEKKAVWQERLDVAARIRENPTRAVAIVFGIGLALGFLTGGRSKGEKRADRAEKRASVWEERARKLLEIAQEQEDEIETLRYAGYDEADLEWDEELEDEY